ncbi:MAG: glycosyltransferase family 4 protein, partial [Acidimicrobiales bacterium]
IADPVLRQPSLRHLHAHFCHGTTTVTWLAATITGRTFSFTAHAKDIYREDLNPAGLLERKLAAATFVATCTEANRRHLEAIHSPAAVHRIYHGLNDDFARLMERPAPPTAPRGSWAERVGEAGVPGRFEILSVGRLVPKKGLDTLVEATRILVDTGIEFGVRLVGEEGEHAPVLRGLVEHHGLGEHITFVPAMSQSDLLAEYRRADVFCLPCRVLADGDRDGIPNVLMEAMATGLPVVTTPISGIPELVEDRVNGLLVPPDDVDALAKALLELADDDELRARLSRAGVEVVRSRFDAWSETRAMVDLLTGSVAGGAAVLARPHGAEHGWS